jgi:hypothetical protein
MCLIFEMTNTLLRYHYHLPNTHIYYTFHLFACPSLPFPSLIFPISLLSSWLPPIYYHSPTHLSIYPPTHLPTYPSTHLPIYPPIHPPTYPPIHLPIYLSTHLSIYPPTHLPIYLSTHLSIYPPIHLPTYPSTYLLTYPLLLIQNTILCGARIFSSIYVTIYLFVEKTIENLYIYLIFVCYTHSLFSLDQRSSITDKNQPTNKSTNKQM